jgi:hypothetical protein
VTSHLSRPRLNEWALFVFKLCVGGQSDTQLAL